MGMGQALPPIGCTIKSINKNNDEDIIITLEEGGVVRVEHDVYGKPHVKYEKEYSGDVLSNKTLLVLRREEMGTETSTSVEDLIKKFKQALEKAQSTEKLGCHVSQICNKIQDLESGRCKPTVTDEVWVDYFLKGGKK